MPIFLISITGGTMTEARFGSCRMESSWPPGNVGIMRCQTSRTVGQGGESRQHLLHHMPVHIGEPSIHAVGPHRKPFMVDPEQV